MDTELPRPKPLRWLGSSKDDLKAFPDLVRKEMGHALYLAQIGMKAPKAKPLVFVLHAFQKKSKRGSQTPQTDLNVIKLRLKAAADIFDQLRRSQSP